MLRTITYALGFLVLTILSPIWQIALIIIKALDKRL